MKTISVCRVRRPGYYSYWVSIQKSVNGAVIQHTVVRKCSTKAEAVALAKNLHKVLPNHLISLI